MAAQLYRLCQRLAILNGFDLENPLQRERAEEIYLLALGFDAAAQAVLKQQLGRAASIAGKRGAYSNYILRLIILVAEKLGAKITTKQAAKFVPVVGGVFGATLNYTFARGAANKMLDVFKDDYFRTWQAGSRGSGSEI
jgi:EcsC protein family